ncbi:MAG: fibronectin type III domain-containing protein [Candidatus Yonathbacteria bacterium]|nr:fibronectin type III domain-containing protein [Candidatus Yonathbacteria bacterium]
MNTIQYSAIFGLAMFAFANHALAAPTLIPSSVTYLSDTKATVVSKVFNQVLNNTTVWFEWGDTQTPATVIGLTDIYQQGYFQANINNLIPGKTYYFRAVAFDGGTTVYSPIVSFTTTGGVAPVGVVAPVIAQPATPVVAYTQPAPIQDVTPVEQKKVSTAPAVTKNTVASVKKTTENALAKSAEPALNANSATVLGAGGNILPGTLIAWLGLFIAILIAVILIRMIIEASEKRKQMLEQLKQRDLREAPLVA